MDFFRTYKVRTFACTVLAFSQFLTIFCSEFNHSVAFICLLLKFLMPPKSMRFSVVFLHITLVLHETFDFSYGEGQSVGLLVLRLSPAPAQAWPRPLPHSSAGSGHCTYGGRTPPHRDTPCLHVSGGKKESVVNFETHHLPSLRCHWYLQCHHEEPQGTPLPGPVSLVPDAFGESSRLKSESQNTRHLGRSTPV